MRFDSISGNIDNDNSDVSCGVKKNNFVKAKNGASNRFLSKSKNYIKSSKSKYIPKNSIFFTPKAKLIFIA